MKSFSFRWSCVLFLPFLLIARSFARADTHYVSTTGSDTPPYTSWQTAASSIQTAIDAASEGDTVLIAPGIFRESIVMKSGLTLTGSGADLTTIEPTTWPGVGCLNVDAVSIERLTVTSRRWKSAPTLSRAETGFGTIQAGWGCAGNRLGTKTAPTAGPTIRTASASSNGGGIYIEQSTDVVIRHCAMTHHRATYGSGGAVYALGSQVRIECCVIKDNVAEKEGGGIFLVCPGQVCKMTGCEIIGNEAWDGRGGGIACYCLGQITGCVVANNSARRDGGGIWCGQTMGISGCLICNNEAGSTGPYGYEANGGGIYYRGGHEKGIINCVIAGNLVNGGRGQGIFWEANANVVSCTILGHTTDPKYSAGVQVAYPAETYGTYENVSNCVLVHAHLKGCRPAYSAISWQKYPPDWEGIITQEPEFRIYAICDVESVACYDSRRDVTTLVCKERIGDDNEYRHMFAQKGFSEPRFFIAGNLGNQLLCYGTVSEDVVGETLQITDFSLSEDSPCIDTGNNEAEYLPDEDKAGKFRIYRGKDEWRVDMGAYEYGSRRFAISAIQPTAETQHLKITWNSQPLPGNTYSIYFSPELLTWTLGGSNIPSRGESTSWVDPNAGAFARRFYRISSP